MAAAPRAAPVRVGQLMSRVRESTDGAAAGGRACCLRSPGAARRVSSWWWRDLVPSWCQTWPVHRVPSVRPVTRKARQFARLSVFGPPGSTLSAPVPLDFPCVIQVLVTVRLRSAAGAGSLGLARFTIKTRLSTQASSRSCPRRPGASGESTGRRGGLFGLSPRIRCTLARRVMTHE
jgi:hypothetical protein